MKSDPPKIAQLTAISGKNIPSARKWSKFLDDHFSQLNHRGYYCNEHDKTQKA